MSSLLLTLPSGVTVACTDTGSGQPILLLHGVCMSRKFFEHNIDGLARSHRVVAMDFRGHGDSPAVELIWGRDEKVIKFASADWLHEALPSSRLEVFDDSGHCPMWEEPQKFNALVTEWAAQRPGRTSPAS